MYAAISKFLGTPLTYAATRAEVLAQMKRYGYARNAYSIRKVG